ncbi:MAG: hypothetical protein QOE69_3191 [Thermoleophilaceae bacterium]|jgi:hypothetical protein|nr:hypothetical protein [Thermoleophilaceae bacterium]
MAPETGTAIVVLAVFVLPGFVTLLIRERTHAIKGEDTAFERLLGALYYSALIYSAAIGTGLLFGLARADLQEFADGGWSLVEYFGVGLLLTLVLPLTLAYLGLLWQRSSTVRPAVLKVLKVSAAHSTPSGWDHFFGQNSPALVRATLTDGRVVGGYFGDESFAGYSDHHEDLFLERRWELDKDAWFVRPAEQSIGVWVPSSSIVSFELYTAPDEREVEPSA